MNTEIEIKRGILKEVILHTIKRIDGLKKQLEKEKEEKKEFGMYEDCGSFYEDAVKITEAKIEIMMQEKAMYEGWRNSLSLKDEDYPFTKSTTK